MYCKNCGKELPENANVCTECGVAVDGSAPLTYQMPKRKSEGGTAGLVLGLVGLIAWFIPIIGYAVSIPGLVLSIKQLTGGNKSAKVIVGLVGCIICLVASLINSILGLMMASSMGAGFAFIF